MNRFWTVFLVLQYYCSFGNDFLAQAKRFAATASTTGNTAFLISNNLQTRDILVELRGGAKKRGKSSRNRKRTSTGSLKVRGDKDKEKEEDSGVVAEGLKMYKKMLPLTRVYISAVVLFTTMGLVLGEELTQQFLALDPTRILYGFEFWRPFSAAAFLGAPSIGWLMNGYYLVNYGSSLERAYGGAQFVIFLLSQMAVLSIVSALLGQPFYANSMITAMLYVLSRTMPKQKVKWLVMTVPYWFLPIGLMVADILQAGNAMAAIPHVIGMLSGHFYHFHKFIWPKMGSGGEDWLVAPDFLIRRFDGDSSSDKKAKIAAALKKSRKRGKGRKLGGKK
mmetsp:Transcript_25209/g.37236  ORF Transcript_25209/g.37236 Transcript_25209/m.37236 type:complete len:335 (-) Transcript_25209:40-1044(-)|eukprot:CAMPEP_0194211740 /NCGR_PEP_ID=MMETSP0156-20130528/11052_1 /TAXON_ID=33649 /ORGANISM="Thalassionema nitzschioides, Strain L26-B" /LENGTH=334 /DNA_ID=CAMNT_0038939385 /DNA_START=104 /DNA_END=1108 /DNA_ORIENTATION=-